MSFEQFITFLLIGIGLSFDSFAVSVSCGLMKQEIKFRQAVLVAFSLAFFQALFPVLGWFLGTKISNLIAAFDHWIAFGLLSLIGLKMIIEGIKPEGLIKKFNPIDFKVLKGL